MGINFPNPPLTVGQVFGTYTWDGEKWTVPGGTGPIGAGTPSDAVPQMDGAGHPGTGAEYSRGDHKHPSDTAKAAVVHTHPQSDITGLTAALGGKAPTVHTHAQADITNLVTDLAGKEPSITAGTVAQYWRGNKSWATLDKAAVGLGNVDNTSDVNKPISSATQTALDLKAPLASPALTGNPTSNSSFTAPNDNNTNLATTAFVKAQVAAVGGGATFIQGAPGSDPSPGAVTRTMQNKARDIVSVIDFGADPSGATYSDAAINAAKASHDHIYFPKGIYRIAASATWEKENTFEFSAFAKIDLDAGATITIRGDVIAPPTKHIFSGPGSVVGVSDVWVEWFGAINDDQDSSAAFNNAAFSKAHACVKAATTGAAPIIRFRRGKYKISSTWVLEPSSKNGLQILGAGPLDDGTWICAVNGSGMDVVKLLGSRDLNADGSNNKTSFNMRDLRIRAGTTNLASPIGTCLKVNGDGDDNIFSGFSPSSIENCFFSNGQYGILAYRLIEMKFSRCTFEQNFTGGAARGVYLSGQTVTWLPGAKFGCDTLRFEYCTWRREGADPDNQAIGLFLDSTSNISAIQLHICQWLAIDRPIYITNSGIGDIGDIWINKCQFDTAAYGAIEIQCGGAKGSTNDTNGEMVDIHITDNYMTASGGIPGGGFFVRAISAGQSNINSVFIHGNWSAGSTGSVLDLQKVSTFSVQDNIFTGVNNPGGAAIFCRGVHNSTIANNTTGQGGFELSGGYQHMILFDGDSLNNRVHGNNPCGRNSGGVVQDNTSSGPNYKYANGPISSEVVQLPDGKIMVWGFHPGGANPSTPSLAVNFPSPNLFRSNPVVTASMAGAPDAVTLVTVVISGISTTGFRAYPRYAISGSVGVAGEGFNWTAIGLTP